MPAPSSGAASRNFGSTRSDGPVEPMISVAVVGAGYAGAHAARVAIDAGAQVTIIEPTGVHTALTRLAAVAAGDAPIGDGFIPLARLFREAEVVERRATAVANGRVVVDGADDIEADAIVVAAGSISTTPPIRGLKTNAHALRTMADARRIRDAIRHAPAITIAGGGPTGVQLAGAIAARKDSPAVTLVDPADRPLPAFDESLSIHAGVVLSERGVRVLCGRALKSVGKTGATLDNGERVDGLTLWAGGYRADGNSLLPAAETVDGRLVVDADGAIPGFEGVFAAGDVAASLSDDGKIFPMSAQVASQAGRIAGHNATRFARGEGLDGGRIIDLGWVVDLRGRKGVADLGPVKLTQPPLDLVAAILHWGIDLRNLWQLGGPALIYDHAPGRYHPDSIAE